MSRAAAVAALSGRTGNVATGVTWVPEEALGEWAGARARSLPDSLALLVEEAALDFAFVPGSAPWAPEAVSAVHHACAAAFWVADGPLGRVAAREGWAGAIRMTAAEPAALAAALDRALHDCLLAVRAGAGAHADALVVADDLAGRDGMLVSPDYALDVLAPLYARAAGEAASRGLPSVFHSDGDVRALYPALARAGFSAVHVADSDEHAFAESARAAAAAGLVAVGGVAWRRADSRFVREGDTPEEVDSRWPAAVLADDGGISSAGELREFVTAIRSAREKGMHDG